MYCNLWHFPDSENAGYSDNMTSIGRRATASADSADRFIGRDRRRHELPGTFVRVPLREPVYKRQNRNSRRKCADDSDEKMYTSALLSICKWSGGRLRHALTVITGSSASTKEV